MVAGLSLTAVLMSGFAAALPSDREQPIHITSNDADADNAKGIVIYRGDVVVTQGTTKMTGDVVTLIYSADRKLKQMIAKGNNKERAFYQEELEGDKGIVKAWGETIDYSMQTDTVELIKQARLIQNGDTFTGDRIEYNQLTEIINAQSDRNKPGGNRVQMIIQPDQTK
ncbi:lipopolysaccharide transport periplasmic protein LptA [Parendozoicomonas haliclonae]|nr:lipopolysaccharide transport periplasmic protein LptA [Parendozoicomonas haliclonae]